MEIIFMQAHVPDQPPFLAGFVLLDLMTSAVEVRTRSDWSACGVEAAEILAGLRGYLESVFDKSPLQDALRHLASFSTTVRTTEALQFKQYHSATPALIADTLHQLLLM